MRPIRARTFALLAALSIAARHHESKLRRAQVLAVDTDLGVVPDHVVHPGLLGG